MLAEQDEEEVEEASGPLQVASKELEGEQKQKQQKMKERAERGEEAEEEFIAPKTKGEKKLTPEEEQEIAEREAEAEGGEREEAAAEKATKEAEEEVEEEETLPTVEETSTFHGESLYDYQGTLEFPTELWSIRCIYIDVSTPYKAFIDTVCSLGRSYLSPASHLREAPHQCFLPKKLIHTWRGHTKAVNCARLFPKYGHLVLSASMDTNIKLWDVYNNRSIVRTFSGHAKGWLNYLIHLFLYFRFDFLQQLILITGEGVRDVWFNWDGSRFISCSYDRYCKLWDTETGQCLGRYTNRRVPYHSFLFVGLLLCLSTCLSASSLLSNTRITNCHYDLPFVIGALHCPIPSR